MAPSSAFGRLTPGIVVNLGAFSTLRCFPAFGVIRPQKGYAWSLLVLSPTIFMGQHQAVC